MKTTLEIPEQLMRDLKERAAREGTTMSELVEMALRSLLERRPAAGELPPLPTWNSGGVLVNIDNRAEWYDEVDDSGADDVRR